MKAVGNRPRRMARREPEDRLESHPMGHIDFCHSSCQGPPMVREWAHGLGVRRRARSSIRRNDLERRNDSQSHPPAGGATSGEDDEH
jgi:hypothetical protein